MPGSMHRNAALSFVCCVVGLFSSAQNLNLAGGGITIASGTTINVPGNITVAAGTNVTNNSNIILTGNWTNDGTTYTGATGTINFTGAATQSVNGSATSHTFTNVVINQSPASSVDLNANTTVAGLTFTSGKLTIGSNNTLTIGGAVTNIVTGGLTGSASSSITIAASNAVGSLSFNQATPGSTNVLQNLSLSGGATASLGNSLNIAAGSTTTPGTISLANSASLTTNDLLTLKSNASGTSRVAEIPVNVSGVALATINGKVTVERWVSSRRAWRLICVPLQHTGASETSIWNAWQEGANNTIDLTTGGSYSTDNQDPNMGFGTHVTSDRNIYNSTTDGFDAASRFYASLLSYNGTNWGGRPANTKNTFVTSQPGWMLFVRGSRAVNLSQGTSSASDVTVLRPKGLLITGRQTTITVTNPSGYNLIKNPFASAIDVTKCTLDGVPVSNTGYYLWDPYILGSFMTVGGYTYYDPILGFLPAPVSPIAANRLEAGSAFFVPSVNGQMFIIPEAAKVANNALVLRPAGVVSSFKTMKTALYVDSAGMSEQADACGQVMDNAFSNDFIQDEDRLKMNNFSENLSLINGLNKLIVEYRKPYSNNDTVFYAISRMGQKKYHFVFEPGNLASENLTATLEDDFTKSKTNINLSQNTRIDFSITADTLSRKSTRFKMVFKQSVTLPVMFTNLKAYLTGNATTVGENGVIVQWNVQHEANVKTYGIEKSADGINFSEIGKLNPVANGNQAELYNFLDKNPMQGSNFYRISSTGIGGEISYSSVVKINIISANNAISVFPNPINNNTVNVKISSTAAGIYVAELTNATGQIITTKQITHNGTLTSSTISPLQLLPPGIYQLKINGPDKKQQAIRLEVRK